MLLVSKTYWGGIPFWFRRLPEEARVESLVLRAHDFRMLRALYWTSAKSPRPKVGVVLMHPRVDFTQHYTVPRLIQAGFGVLAATPRDGNNELFATHEGMVLDVGACTRWLREKRGMDKVVLLGNCGGASLFAYYQAEARLPPSERRARSPSGSPTRFDTAPLAPADAMVYVAAHRGLGQVLLDAIDPSVVDERDPLAVDPALDMYDPHNGFRDPPEWSEYAPDFVARYRAAQKERVRRLDDAAHALIARQEEAERASNDAGFGARAPSDQRGVLRRAASEGLMIVHRTMANPHFVDRHLDPSDREYGSLLSERPDWMNFATLGLGRACTPQAWLSTWSALSSNADLVANVARIREPTLVVAAGADREILPRTDVLPVFEASASPDKRLVTIDGARHYFEPPLGDQESPDVDRLMDVVAPWIAEHTS
jgi:hypothetical protein